MDSLHLTKNAAEHQYATHVLDREHQRYGEVCQWEYICEQVISTFSVETGGESDDHFSIVLIPIWMLV